MLIIILNTDGQKIAIKLAKQQASALKSLKKCLDQCNALCDGYFPALDMKDVIKADSVVFQDLAASQVIFPVL